MVEWVALASLGAVEVGIAGGLRVGSLGTLRGHFFPHLGQNFANDGCSAAQLLHVGI